jgi:hypothetical protein
MKVFDPTDEDHVLQIIPSEYVATGQLYILHELSGTLTDMGIEFTTVNGYLVSSPFEYAFKEGGSYEISVLDDSRNLIYRGKAFATSASDLQNYKLT